MGVSYKPKSGTVRVAATSGNSETQVTKLVQQTAPDGASQQGRHSQSVHEALGHADLQTTMRHYVLAEEETQREVIEALAEVFGD